MSTPDPVSPPVTVVPGAVAPSPTPAPIGGSSPPSVPGAPTLSEAQKRKNPDFDELEGVLVAVVAYLIMGERPREAALNHIQTWFESVKGDYYQDAPAPVNVQPVQASTTQKST